MTENLTDAQYAAMVGRAHVVVLPYRRATFRTRTSGVLLDAIAAGKPIVAARDTWAGDVIERFGIGTTYDDGDVEALEVAVAEIVDDLETYTKRAEDQRDRIISSYLPTRLVAFLAALGAGRHRSPDPTKLASLRATADLASHAHWQGDVVLSEERFRSLVRLDDLHRMRDDALDQVELLRVANARRQDKIDRLTRART